MHHGQHSENDVGEHLNYEEIERRRKHRVDKLAERLLLQRERINKDIEKELERFVCRENISGIADAEDIPSLCETVILEETQSCDLPVTFVEDKDVPIEGRWSTNVFFSDRFISRFILSRGYVEVEEEIKREKLVLPASTQVRVRMQVNKRLTQVSGRAGQVDRISDVLSEYAHYNIFIEIFTLKIIEQGRLQVSSCPSSYREFSELFCRLYSPKLMEYFRVVLFTKEANTNTIRGIYSIYFGILELQDNSEEAWFFIASLLNAKQNEMSCYVVECFFSILGDLLFEVCRSPFLKLMEYVRRHYYNEMRNEPCKSRIMSIFSKYCGQE